MDTFLLRLRRIKPILTTFVYITSKVLTYPIYKKDRSIGLDERRQNHYYFQIILLLKDQ